MDFNERVSSLLQTPATPLTWDSILKECTRLEQSYIHIRSEFQWALEYKRFQVESARGNRSAALIALKAAIATAPGNDDVLNDYKNYIGQGANVDNIVLIVSSKKNEAKAVDLARSFDRNNIQYLIVSGLDTAPIQQVRALQVDAPDSYEGRSRKVAAALTWIYENLGTRVNVLKVEDSMSLVNGRKLLENMKGLGAKAAYVGVPVSPAEFDRCAHWGQCQDPKLNRSVYGRPILRPWAVGEAYYLSAAAVEKIVFSLMRFPGQFDGEFYEDKLIGDVLVFEGVDLTPIKEFADFGLSDKPSLAAPNQLTVASGKKEAAASNSLASLASRPVSAKPNPLIAASSKKAAAAGNPLAALSSQPVLIKPNPLTAASSKSGLAADHPLAGLSSPGWTLITPR
ncbi:hypothetical protein [Herbaspirillum sp. meg3]|uniref:hypothetical protein n=1 Tax=Herbaspirillum sp. meg3 TaxID=2025949 RepID=UPI0018DFE7D3|nr:hypothetical protein [Herbaspirillum sp. meg3]